MLMLVTRIHFRFDLTWDVYCFMAEKSQSFEKQASTSACS